MSTPAFKEGPIDIRSLGTIKEPIDVVRGSETPLPQTLVDRMKKRPAQVQAEIRDTKGNSLGTEIITRTYAEDKGREVVTVQDPEGKPVRGKIIDFDAGNGQVDKLELHAIEVAKKGEQVWHLLKKTERTTYGFTVEENFVSGADKPVPSDTYDYWQGGNLSSKTHVDFHPELGTDGPAPVHEEKIHYKYDKPDVISGKRTRDVKYDSRMRKVDDRTVELSNLDSYAHRQDTVKTTEYNQDGGRMEREVREDYEGTDKADPTKLKYKSETTSHYAKIGKDVKHDSSSYQRFDYDGYSGKKSEKPHPQEDKEYEYDEKTGREVARIDKVDGRTIGKSMYQHDDKKNPWKETRLIRQDVSNRLIYECVPTTNEEAEAIRADRKMEEELRTKLGWPEVVSRWKIVNTTRMDARDYLVGKGQ